MDSSVRETDEQYVVPAEVADRPDGSALVYLSLGSLGSADVELMRRLVDVLGRTPHRFIVSKGPQGSEYELADNMVGAEFLPQTTLIPQVDAVITHGGNNTTTEALHFGKPMVAAAAVLGPVRQRAADGRARLRRAAARPTRFTEAEMRGRSRRRCSTPTKQARSAGALGARIRARDGLRHGADVIERVAREFARGSASA